MNLILKLVSISEAQTITKADGTTRIRQTLVFRCLGSQYSDTFVVTHFGDKAMIMTPGSTIAANLWFATSTYDGRTYQDIILQEYSYLGLPHAPKTPSINIEDDKPF